MSIIWLMIVLLIAAFAASIIISGIMFSRATRENREKIICKTAKLVAGQVDGDKAFGENYHDYMLVRLDGECW